MTDMETDRDRIVRATGETAELRFVLADLTRAANAIADYHGAQAFARILLGETMTSSVLLASGLKGNGTVQVKFQFSGDFSYATADSTPMGLIRAMVPQEDIRRLGEFEPLLSPQIMTVRKLSDRGVPLSEGIVEMPSENIGPCTAFYLLQSEQTKSAVGIKAKANPQGTALLFCGGFLVEALPKADEKTDTSYRESRTTITLGPRESADVVIRCDFEPDTVLVDPDARVLQLRRKLATAKL